MNNRDIYQKDPATRKLLNQGVASVNDEETSQAMAVLRHELEIFVCAGQYEKGVSHILDTYLKNIDQAQQPAVWVSGFFGSGKSHLVKNAPRALGRHKFRRWSHGSRNRQLAARNSR